ncbi:MAG: YdiU family protein [Sphingomonadaceae bacterium]
MNLRLDNTLARQLEKFRTPWKADEVPEPGLVLVNRALAGEIGLDLSGCDDAALARLFTGQERPGDIETVALAYSGHQFGQFSPLLGDGRALLLGEIVGPDGGRRDIHFKGSGRTPYSRGADGKCALGPALREYVISEAMAALSIPSTRSLAVATTGERVFRETPLPGAVLTRVAASHIRVGTFQYAAAHHGVEEVRRLADYAIARHYPDISGAANPCLALLERVIEVQAALVAKWMCVGFVHGVMNTDNVSIAGETIDYGPCAFLDDYSANAVFSSIDHGGRYAFGNQPAICQWNLIRLAEALGGAVIEADADGEEKMIDLLNGFGQRYEAHWLAGMRAKLGLEGEREGDMALAKALFAAMEGQGVDFTLFFRRLADVPADGDEALHGLFNDPEAIAGWLEQWRARIAEGWGGKAAMDAVNPLYIPRNHKVEEALAAATAGDLAPFEKLVEVVTHPYAEREGLEAFAEPAPESFGKYVTFCGT